ncbi:MAG: AAA family ATPase, partial [Bacteroidota bacterium]|nr:AAA family ATPase [Bacteroidota bacterium]
MKTKKIVITGCPATGKSSIVEHLVSKGFYCMKEVSRDLTLKAQKEGVDQLFL